MYLLVDISFEPQEMAEADIVRYRVCTMYLPGHAMFKPDKKKPGTTRIKYSLYKYTEDDAIDKANEWVEENGGRTSHCRAWIEGKKIS